MLFTNLMLRGGIEMIFLSVFVLLLTSNVTCTFDTTIAPKETVRAHDLVKKNHAKIFCQHDVNSDFTSKFPDKFVLELEHARVYEDGHIVTRDNFLLEDTVIKYPAKPLSEYHMLLRHTLPEAFHIKGRVAVLASPGAACYFHWLFQILPRLKILRDLAIDYDAIYLEPITCAFQLEALAKIGLNNKRVIFAQPDTQISADVLIVPSIIIKDPCFFYPSWIIDFLRSTFLDENCMKYSDFKRIYISRSKANMRKVVNEDDVVNILQSHGFVIVHLEDFSLLEQTALIASAEIIVGPHGSGFSNLVFAQPGAHVIEIFNNEEGLNKLFFNLAQAVHLKHHTMICSDEGLSPEQKSKEGILVDLHELELLLASCM